MNVITDESSVIETSVEKDETSVIETSVEKEEIDAEIAEK